MFVDESVHQALGFAIAAFVVAGRDLEDEVAGVLQSNDLEPGRDEFKSGALMLANPKMQGVRGELLGLAATRTRIAVLISRAHPRETLVHDLVWACELMIRRNGLNPEGFDAFFDQGLLPVSARARMTQCLRGARLHPDADSRIVLGIQVADAVAHTVAQVLREQLKETPKIVTIGEESGYENGTEVGLGWSLLMTLRYGFFVRPQVYPHLGDQIDADRDPVVLAPDDDPVEVGQHPDLLGWGVFIAETVRPEVRAAAGSVFEKLWLGCIH